MTRLSIFDGTERLATVTIVNESALIFARSKREWADVNRWISQGFYRLKGDDYIPVTPKDKDFLKLLAERAQGFNFNTELI